MAKVLFLAGSPRAGGNTDDCVGRVAAALAAAGHDTETVRVADRRIEPCRGCRACMERGRCVIEDDEFETIWRKITACDLLVLAAPVYWYGPPGPMKNLVDRSHGYYAAGEPLQGLKAALLSVAADNGCWEPHERILASWLKWYGAEMLGGVHILAREKGDAMASPPACRALDEWANALCEAL